MFQTKIFYLALILGYLIFHIFTHPQSAVHKKLPKLEIKRLQLFPSITITISGRVVHFHHWLSFGIILVISVFVDSGLLSHIFVKGILSGGVVQGIFVPRGLKLIYKKDNE